MTTSTADSSPSSPIAGAPNVSAPAPVRHTWIDNLQGQAFGVVMIAFGMSMLHSLGLITGQVAGLAFLGFAWWTWRGDELGEDEAN